MKRPLAVIGLSMMLSIIVSSYIGLQNCFLVGITLLVSSAVGFFIRNLSKSLPTCVLFCAVGMLIYALNFYLNYMPLYIYDGKECDIKGVIRYEPTYSNNNEKYIVKVTEINGNKADFNIQVTTDGRFYENVSQYDTVEFTGVLNKPKNLEGAVFDNKSYLQSKGVALTAYMPSLSLKIRKPESRPFLAVFTDIRHGMKNSLVNSLGDKAGVALAVMIGDTSLMSSSQTENYRMIGVFHLFAVSGLHMSVLLTVFLWISKKLQVHRKAMLISGILLILTFMGITGFSPSVLRAGIMSIIVLLGLLIFKEADALNSLGAAVIILILMNPFSPLDIGLQMSVFATVGLILLGTRMMPHFFPTLSKRKKEPDESGDETEDDSEEQSSKYKLLIVFCFRKLVNFIVSSITVSVAANIFLLPIYAYHFGSISLLTPIANLFLIPAANIVLVMSLLISLLYYIPFIGGYLAFIPALITKAAVRFIDLFSEFFASFNRQQIGLSGDYMKLTVLFIVFAVIVWICNKSTKISGLMTAACCMAVVLSGIASSRIFCGDLVKVHLWGNQYSACAVINANGQSISFAPEGFYSDMMSEQYRCLDGCFQETEISNEAMNLNGWSVTPLCDNALILGCDNLSVLFLDSPDEAVAKAVAQGNLEFDIMYIRFTDMAVTYFLTEHRIADNVIMSSDYSNSDYFKEKLNRAGYRVCDITETSGVTLTLSENGKYSVKNIQ